MTVRLPLIFSTKKRMELLRPGFTVLLRPLPFIASFKGKTLMPRACLVLNSLSSMPSWWMKIFKISVYILRIFIWKSNEMIVLLNIFSTRAHVVPPIHLCQQTKPLSCFVHIPLSPLMESFLRGKAFPEIQNLKIENMLWKVPLKLHLFVTHQIPEISKKLSSPVSNNIFLRPKVIYKRWGNFIWSPKA